MKTDNPDRTRSQITENNIISQEEAFVSNFAIFAFQMQYGCNSEPLHDYNQNGNVPMIR